MRWASLGWVAVLGVAALDAGCDPCAGFTEPTVEDEDGILPESSRLGVLEAYGDFVSWTGHDGICIDTFAFEEQDNVIDGLGSDRVTFSASATWQDLFYAMCWELDEQADFSGVYPDLFPVDEADPAFRRDKNRRRDVFSTACSVGPADARWLELAETACGPLADETEKFMVETVYPNYDYGRMDGSLSASQGDTVTFASVYSETWNLTGIKPAGGALAMKFTSADSESRRLDLADPKTGERTELLTTTGGDNNSLFGGTQAALSVTESRTTTIYVVNPDSLEVTEVTLDREMMPYWGVVNDGILYAAELGTHQMPLYAIDLNTGRSREISLPVFDAPHETQLYDPVAVPGGFAAIVAEVTVEQPSSDVIKITVYGQSVRRYDAATDTWVLLFEGESMDLAGATTDGLLVGTLFEGASELLGAYDPADDALLVSDDICLDEIGRPSFVLGDDAWIAENRGDDFVLRPVVIAGRAR